MPCCNQDNQQKQATERGTAESGPMAMGMGMARKMMGQDGSPMEMMQKMMAQMGQGGGPPQMQQMMQMCMGMCSEMLDAIRQTTAMAAFATPALQQAFDAWLKDNLLKKNTGALLEFQSGAPDTRFNHPTDEHFLPLFVVMGFGYDTPRPVLLHEEISGGSLSLASYGFPRPGQAEVPDWGSLETAPKPSSWNTGSFPLSE